MSDLCSIIRIGFETSHPIFDPIVGGVGGTIGGIIGIICGILLTKFCCLKKVKNASDFCLKKSKHVGPTFEDASQEQTMNKNSQKESIFWRENFDEDDEFSNNAMSVFHLLAIIKTSHGNCLLETMSLNSIEDILNNHTHITFNGFCEISSNNWRNRCTCMLQVFRLIANDYTANNAIEKTDQDIICQDAERALCKILHQVEKEATKGLKIEDANKRVDNLFADYRTVIHNFECSLLELIGFKDASLIHEVLLKCFKTVEANIEHNQSFQMQVSTETFHRDLLVLQAHHSGSMALKEMMKKRRHYFEVMLNRLVESDRLNEDESDSMWKAIKEEVEKKFDDVIDELEIAKEELKIFSVKKRQKTSTSFQLIKNKSFERYMNDDTSASPSRRIEGYFSLLSEFQSQEINTNRELTKTEIFQINELQKTAKLKLQNTYEEMQEKFCESLFNDDVLNEKEAHVFMNDLTKKNKRAADDVSTVNQIQTKIIEREVSLLRSIQAFNQSEDDSELTISDAVKNKLRNDDLLLSETFAGSQPYLTEEDVDIVMDEYKIYTSLLNNEEDSVINMARFELDMKLLSLQINTLLQERQENRLVTDEDVDNLVKKLEKQRTEFENANGHFYIASTAQFLAHVKRSILCEVVADSLLNNLLPELTRLKKKADQLKQIKDLILNRASDVDVKNHQMQKLAELQQHRIHEIESTLGHEEDLHIQVLRDRFNREHAMKIQRLQAKVDYRPLSASSLSASDLLERLLDQERNKQEMEYLNGDVEARIMSQIYVLRIGYQEKFQSALQDLDKDMLCKFAKAIGLKRNNFIQCIKDSLVSVGEKEKKKLVLEIMQHWKKSNNDIYRFKQETARGSDTLSKKDNKSKKFFAVK